MLSTPSRLRHGGNYISLIAEVPDCGGTQGPFEDCAVTNIFEKELKELNRLANTKGPRSGDIYELEGTMGG